MKPKWSLVFTFFRSLGLDHLEKSIYSLSKQTLMPDEWLFFDNNSDFPESEIRAVVAQHIPEDRIRWVFEKHGDKNRRASWAQNTAIKMATHEIFMLCRGDFIYDPVFCDRLYHAYLGSGYDATFVACWNYQMAPANLEEFFWRDNAQNLLKHTENAQKHTAAALDAASFCTSKYVMQQAGWYPETMVHWGYWQLRIQERMRRENVKMVEVPDFLYFHMYHDLPDGEVRDFSIAEAEARL